MTDMTGHYFQIREDIQTKGEFINGLINKVVDASYVDIEDVLKFVDWLDGELSTLVSLCQSYLLVGLDAANMLYVC